MFAMSETRISGRDLKLHDQRVLLVMGHSNVLVHYFEKQKLLCIPSSYSELVAPDADIYVKIW